MIVYGLGIVLNAESAFAIKKDAAHIGAKKG